MKERGNLLYAEKQYMKAVNCYEEALTAVNYRIDDNRGQNVDLTLEKDLQE